ncbi:hypothetical protein BCR33DRAFT_716727 [Rhizoclosmatium globosum]|uniref:UBA domain-containing protein n=1 Tax=Rhizoclosmatium globosum TaxID=329046 RepID=A0A1Y2CEP3_9FUNG|nr:hypothetical protein BCR33DRAFT_716727 [Rhizoclosmatium globosum]|eukprot:ORY44765.1 hypothetical protein BCR33DRAFT_716727 [Rhizoclosmatium globosum]
MDSVISVCNKIQSTGRFCRTGLVGPTHTSSTSTSTATPLSLAEEQRRRQTQTPPFKAANSNLTSTAHSPVSPIPVASAQKASVSPQLVPRFAAFPTQSATPIPQQLQPQKDVFADLLGTSPVGQSRLAQNLPLNAIAASNNAASLSFNNNTLPSISPMPAPALLNSTPSSAMPQIQPLNGFNPIFPINSNPIQPTAAPPYPPSVSNSTGTTPNVQDPFGLGFTSPPAPTSPYATNSSSVSFNQDPEDDPFGILTGKPTPIKQKVSVAPVQNEVATPSHPQTSTSPSSSSYPSFSASSSHSHSRSTSAGTSRDAHIAMIIDMGFDIPSANSALDASGGDVQEAISMLIANQRALESSASRRDYENAQNNDFSRYNEDNHRVQHKPSSGWLDQPTTSASPLFSNAKNLLNFGRQKVLQVYEKASEKVAAVVEGLDSNMATSWDREQRDREQQWEKEVYGQQPRYRDDTSSDDDSDEEVALERKPRNTTNPASPRGKSPVASSLHHSTTTSTSPIRKQVSFSDLPVMPESFATFPSHQQQSFAAKYTLPNGDYATAVTLYTQAITALPDSDTRTLPLYNNRAAARLKTGDYSGVVEDCTRVLDVWPADSKALLRRAAGFEGRERWREALRDYEELVKIGEGGGVVVQQGLKRSRRGVDILEGRVGADAVVVGGQLQQQTQVQRSAVDELAFLGSPVGAGVTSTSTGKPMSAAAAKAVEKAVESLRAQNESLEREEEEKFAAKEAIEAKVEVWKRGKETNLRALLSSLDSVLWKELGWTTINLSELITPQQVKVRYMKAVAKVHPDKLKQGTTVEQKLIANEVFGTLNKAWDAFKAQSGM